MQMKRLLGSVLFLFGFSFNAQAPVAVPAKNEPHHHLVLENDYVRVLRVSVPAHESTLLHQHDAPYVYVALGPADVINAVEGKPEVHLVMPDGQVNYSRGGFAHIARNESDAPFNNVTIELLHPQGEPRNLCAQVVSTDPPGPCDRSSVSATSDYALQPQFETAEIRVDIVRMSPKSKHTETAMKLPWLVVGFGNSTVQAAVKGKPAKILAEGEVVWADDDSDVSFSNSSSKAAQLLQVTFRKASAQARP
jgi:hypothetical protein